MVVRRVGVCVYVGACPVWLWVVCCGAYIQLNVRLTCTVASTFSCVLCTADFTPKRMERGGISVGGGEGERVCFWGRGGGVTSSVTTRFVKTLWGWPWVHGVGVGCGMWCLHSSDPSQLTCMSPQPSHHGFVYHNRQYASAMPFLPALWKPLPIVEDAAAPTR
jgi:hypothetical protein